MQKKIIVLAIASALTAPALAYAEATVYGQVNLAIEMTKDGNSNSTNANQLNSYGSRIGFMGAEAMDGGMSVVWALEGSVDVDTGGTTPGQFFNRDAYVGLKSDSMGTVLLGRHATPYKLATRRLDLFGDTAADTRGSIPGANNGPGGGGITMMGGGHDIDVSNSINYTSPSMSGFSIVAASAFGAETLPQPAAPAGTQKATALGLAGMFEQGPIYATLAIDNVKYGDPNTGDLAGTTGQESKAIKVGGSYTMDAFAVNAVIEQITDKASSAAADSKGRNLYLGGKFNFSSADAIKAAYTKRGDTTGATNSATQIAIGYDHDISKNTMVYALYTKVTQKATGAPDPSVLSVGVKHSF